MTDKTTGRSIARSEKANNLLYLMMVLMVLLAAGFVKNYVDQQAANHQRQTDQQQRSQCLTDWADAYTARTDKVTTATRRRNDALDTFLAQIKLPQTPAQRLQKLDAYLAEAAAYRATLTQNPIPESPRLRC